MDDKGWGTYFGNLKAGIPVTILESFFRIGFKFEPISNQIFLIPNKKKLIFDKKFISSNA
ncbi:hypothetical protein BpHYR1_046631 [Brachionus plicatilis]|uniref:Uncharacterized protein n=1 Tax=Brachionus plicatilis TaxID=10195 RepID=A0A3M7Q7U7_BRAPC|nr:hypothetical protein BpHYR1_046631 [Brachionus plicatilis]